eukprot:7270849-Alexandrium_andersonii.AAC.1
MQTPVASSSPGTPGTPGTAVSSPGTASQVCICEACGEETTFLQSRPRGSNPLKRWGKDCLNLDKIKVRRLKDPNET